MKKKILIGINIVSLIVFITAIFLLIPKEEKASEPKSQIKTKIEKEDVYDTLTISAAGDCTLGSDPRDHRYDSFIKLMERNNHDYEMIFKGMRSVFATDDLTIVNLEGTFTDATQRANKTFTFKAPMSYGKILPLGSVEAVNLANNHTYDFLEQGYKDTIKTLEENKVAYFGDDLYKIMEIKGVKIGLIGYSEIDRKENIYESLDKGIEQVKKHNVDLIIVNFHWGIERHYRPQESQRKLAKYAIDNGVDLIIGHHSHRIQGIEEYKGKYIVYSLSNFSFGGHTNPTDKDTYVVQMIYDLKNGKIENSKIKIVPVTLSSKKNVNDYQPQVLTGSEHDRVLKKILDLSYNFNYEDK